MDKQKLKKIVLGIFILIDISLLIIYIMYIISKASKVIPEDTLLDVEVLDNILKESWLKDDWGEKIVFVLTPAVITIVGIPLSTILEKLRKLKYGKGAKGIVLNSMKSISYKSFKIVILPVMIKSVVLIVYLELLAVTIRLFLFGTEIRLYQVHHLNDHFFPQLIIEGIFVLILLGKKKDKTIVKIIYPMAIGVVQYVLVIFFAVYAFNDFKMGLGILSLGYGILVGAIIYTIIRNRCQEQYKSLWMLASMIIRYTFLLGYASNYFISQNEPKVELLLYIWMTLIICEYFYTLFKDGNEMILVTINKVDGESLETKGTIIQYCDNKIGYYTLFNRDWQIVDEEVIKDIFYERKLGKIEKWWFVTFDKKDVDCKLRICEDAYQFHKYYYISEKWAAFIKIEEETKKVVIYKNSEVEQIDIKNY